MRIALPVEQDGVIGDGWGRAPRVAVAEVKNDGAIESWDEYAVQWDALREESREGQHHARIARFLIDHGVQMVIAGHMGAGMHRMLDEMHIAIVTDVSGSARDIAVQYGRAQ